MIYFKAKSQTSPVERLRAFIIS